MRVYDPATEEWTYRKKKKESDAPKVGRAPDEEGGGGGGNRYEKRMAKKLSRIKRKQENTKA